MTVYIATPERNPYLFETVLSNILPLLNDNCSRLKFRRSVKNMFLFTNSTIRLHSTACPRKCQGNYGVIANPTRDMHTLLLTILLPILRIIEIVMVFWVVLIKVNYIAFLSP